MKISKEQILHLTKLSALEFTEKEIQEFYGEFNNILGFVDKIASVKVDSDYLSSRKISVKDLRDDLEEESQERDVVLMNAPKQRKGYFNVPKVVE